MNFEERVKNMIVGSYIKVYGLKKWLELSQEEQSQVLHIGLHAMARSILTEEEYKEICKA